MEKNELKPILVSAEMYKKNVARKPKKENFLMECAVCGQKFYAQRRTAKYCSNYCSGLAHKALSDDTGKNIAALEEIQLMKNNEDPFNKWDKK